MSFQLSHCQQTYPSPSRTAATRITTRVAKVTVCLCQVCAPKHLKSLIKTFSWIIFLTFLFKDWGTQSKTLDWEIFSYFKSTRSKFCHELVWKEIAEDVVLILVCSNPSSWHIVLPYAGLSEKKTWSDQCLGSSTELLLLLLDIDTSLW